MKSTTASHVWPASASPTFGSLMSAMMVCAPGKASRRERFSSVTSQPRAIARRVQAELIAMSTDIAEFLGAALGLNLLFGVPLLPAPAKRVTLKLTGHKLYAKPGIMSLEYAVQYGRGSKRRR